MGKEPTKTKPNDAGTGRPEYTDEQYGKWLEEMTPWLRTGQSLYYSMDKAMLLTHQTAIYEKYRLKDWFSQKVDALRANVGEMVNSVGFKVIEAIHLRMIETGGKTQLTTEEVRIWQTMAEKHRTAQPFFVNRTETAVADDEEIGKILDTLEMQSDYDNLGQKIAGQSVAADPPIQNKDKGGATGNVQAQPNTTTTPS